MVLNRTYLFDALLELHDGTITATGAGTIAGSAGILDLGADVETDGFNLPCDVVAQVSAIVVSGGDEGYTLEIQGSSDPAFAADVNTIAVLKLGHAALLGTDVDKDSAAGTQVVGFQNHITNEDGPKSFRYLRLQIVQVGVAAALTAQVFLGQRK